jgi:hypothetical protein
MTINIQDDNQPDKSEFLEFAETMPETAEGFLDTPPIVNRPSGVQTVDNDSGGILDDTGSPPNSTYQPPTRKRVNVTKKVRRAMDRLKKKMSALPIMWFHQQARNNPEWELDADEKELIRDSVETVFEVLDIEIEIEPLSWTLQSVWWVLSYPFLAFLFLFLTKKSATMQADGRIYEPETKEEDVQ